MYDASAQGVNESSALWMYIINIIIIIWEIRRGLTQTHVELQKVSLCIQTFYLL